MATVETHGPSYPSCFTAGAQISESDPPGKILFLPERRCCVSSLPGGGGGLRRGGEEQGEVNTGLVHTLRESSLVRRVRAALLRVWPKRASALSRADKTFNVHCERRARAATRFKTQTKRVVACILITTEPGGLLELYIFTLGIKLIK